MKMFPVLPVLWFGLLVLWSSNTVLEANNTDVCQEEIDADYLFPQSWSELGQYFEVAAKMDQNISCLLHPTNILNCSWWFPTLKKDTQLSVYMSICDDVERVHFLNCSSEERFGSMWRTVLEQNTLNVIIQFNVSLHDKWTVYTKTYDMEMLEVLPPPENISASIKDGGLVVTWSKPKSRTNLNLHCSEFELVVGDQEKPISLHNQLSHTEPNADPGLTYRVRMRARRYNYCTLNSPWGDWSHTVTVEQTNKLSLLIIISMSLGIPMILLALLLLVRHQRVSEVLFPSIPRPPEKYKGFLEKSDTFNFFHPAPSAEPVEEITEVEDMEQNSG
ncbi:interleukin-5 receptor subunit alpha isoform X1 [Labrus bergylta]|uniref:interleukin-5 receptor subunit alpha isoform X1 n=1 Tax=Labrus bergylta TaxID=56723 RepID=UPI0033135A2A